MQALELEQVLRADGVELARHQIDGDRVARIALVLVDRGANQPTLRDQVLERDGLCRQGRHEQPRERVGACRRYPRGGGGHQAGESAATDLHRCARCI